MEVEDIGLDVVDTIPLALVEEDIGLDGVDTIPLALAEEDIGLVGVDTVPAANAGPAKGDGVCGSSAPS